MNSLLLVLSLLLLSLSEGIDLENYKKCLNSTNFNVKCFCVLNGPFDHTGIVSCTSQREVQLSPLMCVTSTTDNNDTFIGGECPFTGQSTQLQLLNTTNIMNINDEVCGKANRSGKLCGKCADGYGLAINTFGLDCINGTLCHIYNWGIHFTIEFIVLTTFLLLVLVLNIKATAECATVFILFAQVISLPINLVTVQRDWAVVVKKNDETTPRVLSWLVDLVYGIWSLRVPSGIIRLCPSVNTTSLEAFSIQFATAFYPLLLTVLIYFLIRLHQRGFKPVSLLWSPFRACCLRFRRRIDPKSTIVDTFATFVLLSYTKFTHISLIILAPTPIYNITGDVQYHALLYDARIKYFSEQHMWYAILAITILVIFVVPLPLLLFFYSTRVFQKTLHCMHMNSHALTLFINAFQSGYKDGSEGGEGKTIDCRFFAGINFLVRISIFTIYTFISNYFILYTVLLIIVSIYAALLIIFQPYKRQLFNKTDTVILIVYNIIITIAIFNSIQISKNKPSPTLQTVFYLTLFVPAIYMGLYMTIWCVKKIVHYFRRDLQYSINEEGEPRTRFGRLIRSIQFHENNSLPSPVEDRDLLSNNMQIEGEYSSSYVNYCETPIGTNNTTERSSQPTDRSTIPTFNSTNNNITTVTSTCSSSERYSHRSHTGSHRRWPLSLRVQRESDDLIALTETS